MGKRSVKRGLISVWLLLVSVSAIAQQRTVDVRLFWQHPPEKIRIDPAGATLKSCANCAEKKMISALEINATSPASQMIVGRARISGEGFAPFPLDGELTVQPRAGVLLLTLKMSLEDYVAAVLEGESAGFKSDEALKAMAVAARTYAAHFGSRHRAEGFDFCDTTHCQDVRLGNESARVRAAVSATQGELLWYQGRPAATYYHRSCGGEIEGPSALDPNLHAPYLRSHQDQYCSRSDEWHAEISLADLSRALGRQVDTVSVATRSQSGRVQSVLLSGHTISATDFRLSIGRTLGWDKVRSDLYQLEIRGGSVVLRGRGQGHGVGLCQVGADNMGQQGRGYREILAYYYPGTSLGVNAQGMHWQTLPGESVDVITTNEADASILLPVAERALRTATERIGWMPNSRPQVKVFPTIAIYRDATGEPGWVAASTRGNLIRLQPVNILQQRNALSSTLLHEFLHMVLESRASANAPLWLREGLVVYLENPALVKPAAGNLSTLDSRLRAAKTEAEMRAAYRDSASAVAELVAREGLPAVLAWMKNGLPSGR
jgi:stage II sporulation protein D